MIYTGSIIKLLRAMNKRIILLFFILFCICSCDISSKFVVDGNPEKRILSECGGIILRGHTMSADYIELSFHGDYIVNIDSIKMLKNGIYVPASEIRYSINNKELKDRCFQTISDRDSLSIIIHQGYSLNYGHKGKIELLPSGFIYCNGKPVISETISFECKAKK